jgi:hypothetical protein
MFKLCAKLCG